MDKDARKKWFQLSVIFTCCMGIAGYKALKIESARAEAQNNGKSGFLPGARPFNPFSNTAGNPHPGQPVPGHPTMDPFLDDEDDDEFEDEPAPYSATHPIPSKSKMAPQALHPRPRPPGTPGAQAGINNPTGSPGEPPNPVRNQQGISVGGQQNPHGVVTRAAPKDLTETIQIDNETAEGSKEIITDFNFPDADILDIAKTLGKLTGKNFIYDNKDVKGRITIVSNSPITVGAAWKAFLTALDVTGFALVPSGNYLRIIRSRDARDKQLKTYTGDTSPDTDALITRVFQLKYISAEEVARTFRNFMPPNSRIIPYEQTNSVIVTDTGSNISKLSKMLDILDVEGYEAGIEVIPVKFASAVELSKLIDTLIPGTAAPGGGAGGGGLPRFGGPGGGKFNARRTKEGGIINTIIADERTNTLIVHANSRGADQVRELVAKLDQKLTSTVGGGRIRVVYLQFADSEQISTTLNNLSQTSGAGNRPTGSSGSGTGINPVTQSLFEGAIKISPDKATNSLVITASPSDFITIQRVINRLDIPRNQVYVEVVIMEVGIGNSLDFSTNIVSAPSLIGSVTNPTSFQNLLSGNPFGTTGGALISFAAGEKKTITTANGSFEVSSVMGIINALQGNTSTNVLATPQIIALDNTEATFESSDKIPTLGGTSVTGNGISQQNIVKEPVILSIKIKPQINKVTNFVKLDITTKLGDITNTGVPAALANQTFATQDRTAQTSVVVGDSDTIVLGGLIRDKIAETFTKVPILGDIPLLGWLFKSKATRIEKKNLLIFMTPHIIRQYEKIRAILDRKLKERDDFLETNSGGDDPLRSARDKMIRSLPDLDELNQKVPQSTFLIDDEKPAAVLVPTLNGATQILPPEGTHQTDQPPTFNPEDRLPTNPEAQGSPVQGNSSVQGTEGSTEQQAPPPIAVPPPPVDNPPESGG